MFPTLMLVAAVIDLAPVLHTVADASHLPAMQATVVDHRGVLAHGAVGITVLGGKTTVTNDDAFHIGSCTKPFTATLLAMLVEEHKLAWDRSIVGVFPEWKQRIRPEYATVTIADLLSHQSGLAPFEDDKEFVAVPHFAGSLVDRRRAFAEYALSQPPVVAPRTAYHYSNAGFVVAAAIAERVSGSSWEELMQQRIFKPLGLHSAGFGWPAKVWGHESEKGRLVAVDPHGSYQLPDYFAPAGDVHMSSDDLAAFLRAHLRAMRGEATLIRPETAAVMHTKRLRGSLGFGVGQVAGFDDVATYSGSADTFFTVLAISARGDVAVVVSTNAAGDAAQKAVGSTLKDLLERYAKRPTP
jgi:CubicO group peptidase (beta-lactamase class C family)